MQKKRTVKQIQAQRRNEIIMSLTGMHTNLRRFRDHYYRSWYLKDILNVAIRAIEAAGNRFKNLPNDVEDTAVGQNGLTWHSMFKPN